jgi:hypothetical protein
MSDDTKGRRAAFMRGLWNGLAGPVSLFAEPRRIEPATIEIKKLHRSIANPAEAMRADWAQVGADLYAAFKKQKQAT